MKKKVFIGIDVSKSTLDIFIHGFDYHFIVQNNTKGFVILIERSCKVAKCKKEELFFCFENPGKYSRMLSVFFHTNSFEFAMEPAIKIKRSLGLTRGKNDKVDAKRIALYAYEKKERLSKTILPDEKIDRIKALLSLREKLIKHRTSYKNGLSDLHDCYKEGENNDIKEIQEQLIFNVSDQIEKIENQIYKIIKSDNSMLNNHRLLLSVKGIGKILAFYFIAFTGNFTLFATARAFACYAGIAPFEYSSGTMKGTPKVHPFANKQLKMMLNMGAQSATRVNGEYRIYYLRRINELGKSKMSTLNIIRNKIVFRAFSVVKRGSPYVDLYKFAA